MTTVGVNWGPSQTKFWGHSFPPVFFTFDDIGDVYGASAEDDLSTGNRPKGDVK